MVNKFIKKNILAEYFIKKYKERERSREIAIFARSMERYLQDSNVGNGGDRLKHAILLEVLQRIRPMKEWSYRETHAGAGFYPMNAHTQILLKAIREWEEKEGAGSTYRHMLDEWWTASVPCYPGSVILAARFLHALKDLSEIDIRVTEVEPVALSRLSVLGGDYGVKVRADSFDKQMEWLCQGSSLMFTVDPYFYDRNATDTTKGQFGKMHLFDLFERLSQKKSGIALIFTADPEDSPRRTYEELRHDIDNYQTMPVVRHFKLADRQIENGVKYNIYWVSIVGFGIGVDIVKDIPSISQWRSSWLNMDIFKQVYNTRIEEVLMQKGDNMQV